MSDEWGSVDGDINASAIIADRRSQRRTGAINTAIHFALLIGTAVWYAMTGSHVALAIEVVFAAWAITSAIGSDVFGLQTYVLIAERRTQLLEQKVQQIQTDLAISESRRRSARDNGGW